VTLGRAAAVVGCAPCRSPARATALLPRAPKTPPFSPITHHTSEQDDAKLIAYLRNRLGLKTATITNITTSDASAMRATKIGKGSTVCP